MYVGRKIFPQHTRQKPILNSFHLHRALFLRNGFVEWGNRDMPADCQLSSCLKI